MVPFISTRHYSGYKLNHKQHIQSFTIDHEITDKELEYISNDIKQCKRKLRNLQQKQKELIKEQKDLYNWKTFSKTKVSI